MSDTMTRPIGCQKLPPFPDEYRSAENSFGRSCGAGARPAVGGGENRTRPVSLQTIRFSEAAGCAISPVMHAAIPQATPAYVILEIIMSTCL